MIRTVFFDLDDTLYDHQGIVVDTLDVLRKRLPQLAVFSDQEVLATYHELLEEYHQHFVHGNWPFEEAHRRRWQAMLDRWSVSTVDPEEMRVFWRQAYFANQKLVPGAKELLESLRHVGISIGIVTNNKVSDQLAKVRDCKIDHLIDHLIISEEVGFAKPDEGIFNVALDRSNTKPFEAVMIGDHWENDVVPSSHLGMRALWLNRRSLPIPDASIAIEINSLEPIDAIQDIILGRICG